MKRTLVTALVAFGALLTSGDASAFCRSTTCRTSTGGECAKDEDGCPAGGAKLFWASRCISYAFNELGTEDLDPGETRDVIRKTFQAWSDVPCGKDGKDGAASITFQERDPVSCKKNEYNTEGRNLNVVFFEDTIWNYRGIDGTLAKASVTYNDQTGEIYDADIAVNAAYNKVTITDDPRKIDHDLQAIITHEVGHFIGIAHSLEGSAVMFASYSPGSTAQRRLTQDDVKAVCTIYPPNRAAACDVEPRGGFGSTCGPEEKKKSGCSVGAPEVASTGPLTVLALGVLTAIRRIRRLRQSRRA